MNYNTFDFKQFIDRKISHSLNTFGPGQRYTGVIDHIKKELIEIEKDPSDLTEWIDVILLSIDGAWRMGYSSEQIIQCLIDKLEKNEKRKWPNWQDADLDKSINHIKEKQKIDVIVDFDEHNYCIRHEYKFLTFPSWHHVEEYCKDNNLDPRII